MTYGRNTSQGVEMVHIIMYKRDNILLTFGGLCFVNENSLTGIQRQVSFTLNLHEWR